MATMQIADKIPLKKTDLLHRQSPVALRRYSKVVKQFEIHTALDFIMKTFHYQAISTLKRF